MAENGRRIPEQSKSSVDKEIRLRSVKDRQNEERQRKLEEIKAQALAAQIFKEQKEQERRRRLDEMRIRDDERRQQVEERKRAINDAERGRLEFIIKRNQDREQRMETKRRHERSSAVFAFGSSTPRMLDPSDMAVSYWGARRATSIQNIITSVSSSLTRRPSERELDIGSKKRAASASGLERTVEGNAPVIPAGCASGYLGRRRTDLVPTIPTKDSISSSHKSLNHSPGRAYSMSRLDQLAKPRKRHDLPSLLESSMSGSSHNLSQHRDFPMTRSVSHIAVNKSRPRTELNKADSRSMQQLTERPVVAPPRTTRTTQLREQKMLGSSNCSEASSRPSSSLSQQSTNSIASSVSVRHRLNIAPRKPRPVSIAVTGVTHELRGDFTKPPLPKPRKPIQKPSERIPPKIKTKTPIESVTKTIVKNTISKDESKKPHDKASNQKSEVIIVPPNELKPENGKVETDVVNVPQHTKSDVEIVADAKLVNNLNVTVNVEQKDFTEAQLIDIQAGEKESKSERQILSNVNITAEKQPLPPSEKTPLTTEKIEQPAEKLPHAVEKPSHLIKNQLQPIETQPIEKPSHLIKNQPQLIETQPIEKPPQLIEKPENSEKPQINEKPPQSSNEKSLSSEKIPHPENSENQLQPENENDANSEMTASMTKSRITTEEEAKAALAERRRLIREEAERQAELEKLRIEAEAKAELERQQQEEEQIRQLIELQRQTEQERLQEAIKEAQKREEEEKLKKEEEQRMKLLKEEAEKKAREEAEKQKAELQERLKNEEKEREARRKRVEAIMLRTRGKNNANLSSQSNDEKNENKSEEIKDSVENKVNGTKIEQENGTTKIAKDIVDNLIPNEIVKNANTVTIESMNTNDSINSNNAWRDNQQYDSLM